MAKIIALSKLSTHRLNKDNYNSLQLLKGLGVEGDAHCGKTVKHRSRVKQDPTQPNLRQVHFMHAELFDELKEKGFQVSSGQMGENVTTRGIDLLGLPVGAKLHLGENAIVEITGLRNPCAQLEGIQKGLMEAVLDRDKNGELIRKAGIMGIVLEGGEININDEIKVEMPKGEFRKLEKV